MTIIFFCLHYDYYLS